jgi:hypothetical protein
VDYARRYSEFEINALIAESDSLSRKFGSYFVETARLSNSQKDVSHRTGQQLWEIRVLAWCEIAAVGTVLLVQLLALKWLLSTRFIF